MSASGAPYMLSISNVPPCKDSATIASEKRANAMCPPPGTTRLGDRTCRKSSCCGFWKNGVSMVRPMHGTAPAHGAIRRWCRFVRSKRAAIPPLAESLFSSKANTAMAYESRSERSSEVPSADAWKTRPREYHLCPGGSVIDTDVSLAPLDAGSSIPLDSRKRSDGDDEGLLQIVEICSAVVVQDTALQHMLA